MTRAARPAHRRPTSRRWWLAAVALLVVAAVCLAAGLRAHQHALAGPAPPTATPTSPTHQTLPATTEPGKPAQQAELSVARSVPVLLRIPAIGVAVPLSTLGLNPDGTVQVPTDFAQPGWYRLGPSPGQIGSAVILGHVDSYQGPAVFFQLRSLHVGDAVEVTLADGVVAHFAVTAVAMYSKAQFPPQQVYGSHGYAALQLVTCGGQFDRATGHYLSNVVVYTDLVATTPTARPAAPPARPASQN
jgi:sortase (surface protein transpeptidase)